MSSGGSLQGSQTDLRGGGEGAKVFSHDPSKNCSVLGSSTLPVYERKNSNAMNT